MKIFQKIVHPKTAVFLFSFICILTLENVYRSDTDDGLRYQMWNSDELMQTLPSAQLRDTPLQSLWYLHKKPPAFDSLRAIIAQIFKHVPSGRLIDVIDKTLHFLWTLGFAALATLIFVWLKKITQGTFAFLATLIWVFHPAPIFYATLLDNSLPSTLLVTWIIYELWGFKNGDGSIGRLLLAVILVFYTRSFFQWYFFPVIVFSLIILKASGKQLMIFITICFILVFPYLLKQRILFGTWLTTTFSGYHKCGLIWYQPTEEDIERTLDTLNFDYPKEADRYNGRDFFNREKQCIDNIVYTKLFREQLQKNPRQSLAKVKKSLKLNFQKFLRPSSVYSENIIVKRLIWTRFYNFVFSGRCLIILLFASTASWIIIKGIEGRLWQEVGPSSGLLLPILYIGTFIMLSNRETWSETDRFKFFLEPCFFVYLIAQIYFVFNKIRKVWFRGNSEKSVNH